MEPTESKQKQVEQSQDNAPVQDSAPTAAASDPQAQNEQKSQGFDLAHGNTSELIARGESMTDGNDPYTAMNYHVEGEEVPRSAYFGLVNGRYITDYTFGELEELSPKYGEVSMTISFTDGDPAQYINGSLFALGKYQMVPEVRLEAMETVGLPKTALFSPENQDLCFTNHLIVKKRPAVMAYLSGESDDIEVAALEIAMEWAAVGIAPGEETAKHGTGADNGLTSFYDGVGGNAASVSYEEIKEALRADRAAIASGGVATHTAVTSNDTPASIYPSSNITPQANNVSEANVTEPTSTNIDLDEAVAYNRMYGYSPETWIEIQRGIGMPESEVDGDVGPITSQAIADWQASRGFSASDVDGICGPMTLDAIRSGMPAVSAAIAADPVAQQVTENPAAAEPVTEPAAPTPAQTEPAPAPAEPAPAPAEPAPAPTQAEAPAAGLLTPEQVQAALDWNIAKDYAPETIVLIQRSTGAPETGVFCAADMQKIAAWQQLYGLSDVDGMFGSQAMAVSEIPQKFNHALNVEAGWDTPDWCNRHNFVSSSSLDDLKGDFRESAKKVINGIIAAGGEISISATFRHKVRAAIMNYCYCRSEGWSTDEAEEILADNNINISATYQGAEAAVDAFQMVCCAATNSRHIDGLAVDMEIHKLPDSFQYDGYTIETGGNRGGKVSNAEALDDALSASGVCYNFNWIGTGDYVHWSSDGH